jgi:hypothetical protein
MSAQEFNEKYKDFLEEGHYGLDIHIPVVIEYLDTVFKDLTKIEGFKYSQIKLKFNMVRFYTNLSTIMPTFGYTLDGKVEKEVDVLVRIDDAVRNELKKK